MASLVTMFRLTGDEKMGVTIDLKGQRFGMLLLVERVGVNQRRQSLWSAVCDCGATTQVLGTKVQQGRQTSCGCKATNKVVDISGMAFGRLIALGPSGKAGRHTKWTCLCECGTIVDVSGAKLRSGHTQSCGCLQREMASNLNLSHGWSGTRTYEAWKSIWQRTTNPKRTGYENYGGRGIKVCDRWREFTSFLADMGEKPNGLTIERVDNDGDYSPSNCIWADMTTQNRNKRPRRIT